MTTDTKRDKDHSMNERESGTDVNLKLPEKKAKSSCLVCQNDGWLSADGYLLNKRFCLEMRNSYRLAEVERNRLWRGVTPCPRKPTHFS